MKLADKQPGSEKRVIEGAGWLIWKLRNEFDQKLLGAQPEIDSLLLQWKKRIDDPIGYETVAYDEIGRLTHQIFGFSLSESCKLKASGTTGIQQWLALHKVSATLLPSGSVYVGADLDLHYNHRVRFARPWDFIPVRFAEVGGVIDVRGHSPVDFSWLPPQERIELLCDDETWSRISSMCHAADSERIATEMREIIRRESQLAEGETIAPRRSVGRL